MIPWRAPGSSLQRTPEGSEHAKATLVPDEACRNHTSPQDLSVAEAQVNLLSATEAAAMSSQSEHLRITPQISLAVLCGFFLLSAILRARLGMQVQSFRFINDEMLYWNMAHSLAKEGRFLFRGVPTTFINILYPLLLAPLTRLTEVTTAFLAAKVLGAVLISSVVFPAFLIARRFLPGFAWPLAIAATSLLVPEMIFASLLLTEVLFYPLALWFILLVIRYLEAESHRQRLRFLLAGVLLSLALYSCKSSAIFLPLSFGILLIVQTWRLKDWRWEGLQRIALFGGMFTMLYLAYNLLFMLGNQLKAFSASEMAVLFRYFNPGQHLPYLLTSLLLYLVFFSLTVLVFPVLVPLLHLQNLSERDRLLTLYALIALIVGALIIVLSVSLGEDFPNPFPRIHLRYLFPLLLLWLPLSLKILQDPEAKAEPGTICLGLLGLLLPYALLSRSCSGLIEYDAPARVLASWCKTSEYGADSAYAGFRFLVVIMLLAGAGLIQHRRLRLRRGAILLASYLLFSLLCATRLQSIVAYTLTSYQEELLAEIRDIGNYLAANPGEILLICNDPRGDAMLEPYLPRSYYLIWEGDARAHDFLWQQGSRADLRAAALPVHVQYSFEENRPWVEELRYVILCGMPRQLTLTPESLQAVPVETKSYQIYELRDPHALYPLQTLSGPASREESHVLQYQLRYLASTPEMLLSCTIELAETIPGEGVEFCISEVDAEVEETVIFLSNTWRTITHRLQARQGAAEGDNLPFFDLHLTLRDLAGTPLRFKMLSYSIN